MVLVFAVFASGSIILLQQLGIGLAAANWLEWLPRLEHDAVERVEAPPLPAPTS